MTASNNNILRHFSRCPLCEAEYGGVRISVVQQHSDRTVFHITCPSCETSMLLVMTQGQMGALCVGSVTDITTHELDRLMSSRIEPNAVLDLYIDLHQYTGSLASVLHVHKSAKNSHKKYINAKRQ